MTPAAPGLGLPLLCCWLLMLVTFSAPGRETPAGLDVIGLTKLGVRAFVVLSLARDILLRWDHPRRPLVVWLFTPFAAFVGWSLVTIAWSPMKAVSLGQWGGLLGQSLLAASVALRWAGPADTSALLRHLCLGLVSVSAVLTAVDFVSHDVSGLNRDEFLVDASTGLFHPTSAGATGALGVVLLVAVRVLWGWPWTRTLLVPGVAACAALLFLSHSRTALAMTGGALGLVFLRFTRPETVAGGVLCAAVVGTAYLLFDPGLGEIERGRRDAVAYLRRGETDEQMSSLNGRGELWDAVWDEWRHAPLAGHGYFLTSRTGILDVWSGPSVRTAHNFVLQALVSTGLIGLGLYAWGMWRPLAAAARAARGPGEPGRHGALLLLLGLWFLGWGQLCESFLGPVQPESVVFYGLFGVAAGQVRDRTEGGGP